MTCDRTLALVRHPSSWRQATCPVMVEANRLCLKPLSGAGPSMWSCEGGHFLSARAELHPVGGIGAVS